MPSESIETVILKFPKVVTDRYDFKRAIYTSALKPITGIVCPSHGEFSQYSAQLRKNGAGCPACGHEQRTKSQTLGKDQFIAKCLEVHADKYDYSKTNYIKMTEKVVVTCRDHGDFKISPIKHVHSSQGCPECGAAKRGKRNTSKNVGEAAAKTSIAKHAALFESKSREIHGSKYDYSKAVYTKAKDKIALICKTHGEFFVSAWDHINKGYGCPQCSHHLSNQENAIHSFLSNLTSAEQRNRTIIRPKEVDIYLPAHNIGVEYCGMYWHSHGNVEDEKESKLRHFEKHQLCAEKGIRLITIYESEWQDSPRAIKRLLRNAIGKSRGKVMARKCDLRETPTAEARTFYDKYHPQGGTGYGDHYGLYWKGKLVACMRFSLGSNDRGSSAKNREWTLSRYATRVTVTGGASRLFKAFLEKEKPELVKSFSDNRYFGGTMYEQLGFALDDEIAPDYQVWSQKIGLKPKSHYQRRELPSRLVEHGSQESFDPDNDPRTEREMTYLMGARRIYDCGKKRWVWRP